MNTLKKEELPPDGHVMAIIESMNRMDFLKFRSQNLVPPDTTKSLGAGTSLAHTRSSMMSLSSSSFDISSSVECEIRGSDSTELEALYDNRFQATCQSNAVLTTHFSRAKYVCVCSKKKCEFGSKQRKLSKSLSDLESTACNESISKKTFRKYLTAKLERDSSRKIARGIKTLPLNSNKKWPSLKRPSLKKPSVKKPMETFEIHDTCDSAPKSGGKRKTNFSAIRKLKRDAKSLPKENINGVTNFPITENMNGGVMDSNGGVDLQNSSAPSNCKKNSEKCCKRCLKIHKITPIRIILMVFGTLLFLMGATYDIALRHGVESLFNSCWTRLKEDYQMFGENFITYQEQVFQNKGKPNVTYKIFDENFLSILENTEFSFQIHFFNIREGMTYQNTKVKVNDIGRLYFKIDFKRDKGLEVKYIRDKSNITLSSTFEVYDIMKAMLLSNQLPYFGFHIKDHYKTTPTALLNVFIDSLSKFQVDTSFFSTLESQIVGSTKLQRSKRSFDSNSIQKSMESLMGEIFLPLPLDTNRRVNVPMQSLRRNFSLTFQNSEMMSGLEGYRFIIQDHTHLVTEKWTKKGDRTFSSNGLFKSNPYKIQDELSYTNSLSIYSKKERISLTSNFSMPGNVINLNTILLKLFGKVFFLGKYLHVYPFWISFPHFISSKMNSMYRTDPKINFHHIEGFAPEENRHGSYIYYHPLLGVPFNASIAVQIGVYPPDGMLYAHKLVPIMWVRVQLDKIHPTLWFVFWVSFYIRAILILSFIFSGISIITCALKCSCGKKCDEQMV